jgi:hypothetical protein
MEAVTERAVLAGARAWIHLRHARLVRQFARRLGYIPDPSLPRTYNEKILWRKVFDRDPRFPALVDKLASKAYARERCPELTIPRTLWIGEHADAIPDAALDGDIVVKVTHGFDWNVFIADGRYDRGQLVATVGRWLKTVHGRREGEWAYGRVRPRVFVEERLPLGGGDRPTDLKIHACDGEIVHGWAVDKINGRAVTLSAAGKPIAPAQTYAAADQGLPDGNCLRARFIDATRFAAALSKGVDYARCDFLVTERQLYFGEITLYPAAGYDSWEDPAVARRLAQCWDLRKSAFFATASGGCAGLYARALRAQLDRQGSGVRSK